mmetsp:Transcript_27161/g.67349  ORF Transcript_27161/g.67349 Transcript_27161/m.67349 type:complete len:212 (+) Transcript_27161:2178-2813(+)
MLELRAGDQDRRGGSEAREHRVGDVPHDDAHVEHCHQQVQQTDHEREQHHGGDVVVDIVRRHNSRDRVGDEERDERERADRHVHRRARERVHGERDQRAIEPVDRRQLGEHGVGDALRDEDDADGQPGHQVGSQQRARVRRAPLQDGKFAPLGRRGAEGLHALREGAALGGLGLDALHRVPRPGVVPQPLGQREQPPPSLRRRLARLELRE